MQIFNTTGIHKFTKRSPVCLSRAGLIALITAVLAPQDFSTDGRTDVDGYASWRVSNTLESIERTCRLLNDEGVGELEVLDKWVAFLAIKFQLAEHDKAVAEHESKVQAIRSEVDSITKRWHKIPLLGRHVIGKALRKGELELSELIRPVDLDLDLDSVEMSFDIVLEDALRHAPLSYYVKRADDVKKYYESE